MKPHLLPGPILTMPLDTTSAESPVTNQRAHGDSTHTTCARKTNYRTRAELAGAVRTLDRCIIKRPRKRSRRPFGTRRRLLRVAGLVTLGLSFPLFYGCDNTPDQDKIESPKPEQSLIEQIERGRRLFELSWTHALGAGHRNSQGVVDLDKAERMGSLGLEFEVFATPAVTSCLACHNVPNGLTGGSGQLVTNVIVVRKTASDNDHVEVAGLDEVIVNASLPPTVFGAGVVEMIARQMSAELAVQRDSVEPGQSVELKASDVSFGTLSRNEYGKWNTSNVQGLSENSLRTRSPDHPPTLQIKPFHQTGSIASIREFTINAFDFHLGVQATERFGRDKDPDRDGVVNELTEQQLNDIVLYQAALPPPSPAGTVRPSLTKEAANGERRFEQFGCTGCHQPIIELVDENWLFTDTNDKGEITVQLDLTDAYLEGHRPQQRDGKVAAKVYSDFKLHDISEGPGSRNRDALHMHSLIGSEKFFEGTGRFLTARLWGLSDRPPYFHHGQYTSLREAVEGHGNEAASSRQAFREASSVHQQELLEFLKTL